MRRSLLGGWLALCLAGAAPATATELTGINLAGGEFGGFDAKYGYGYVYPGEPQIDHFAALGMNVFRVPMRWERIVTQPGSALIEIEMKRIDGVIAAANARGVSVVIDIHNYGRFRGQPLGSLTVSKADLADLWSRLATRYGSNPKVIFGLMNEPVHISAADWAGVAQSLIDAIRDRGASNLILVPGANWSGAHSWTKRINGVSNADAMQGLRDPQQNFAFDFHQYFDPYSSGAGTTCVTETEAARRIGVATIWLVRTGNRGFLSEFGVGRSPECLLVLRRVLTTLAADPHWLGWTIWASAQWFGTYQYNLHPSTNPPQLEILKPFLTTPPVRPVR